MRYPIPLCLFVLILLAPASARGGAVREDRPNLIAGELGGKAIIYSVMYERYLHSRVGIGIGGMAWLGDDTAGLIPLTVSLIPVGDVHSLYLSAGVDLIVGVADYEEDPPVLGTFTIGYQYHSHGGLFVRPTLNVIYTDEALLGFPGLAIGGSF